MKRNRLSILIFLVGLGILLYPWVTRPLNIIEENKAMDEYYEMMRDLTPDLEEALIEEYEDYNIILSEVESNEALEDSAENTQKKETMEVFNGRLLGVIDIPKLKLKVPLYQGATVENLRRGAGHISGTSLPTGEVGSHSVLAGHNRFRNKKVFTNIHKLKIGDDFKVESLGKTLEYKIVDMIVIEPYETDYLMPEEGKDKVTLLTCSDFGKKRLLVIGERK